MGYKEVSIIILVKSSLLYRQKPLCSWSYLKLFFALTGSHPQPHRDSLARRFQFIRPFMYLLKYSFSFYYYNFSFFFGFALRYKSNIEKVRFLICIYKIAYLFYTMSYAGLCVGFYSDMFPIICMCIFGYVLCCRTFVLES